MGDQVGGAKAGVLGDSADRVPRAEQMARYCAEIRPLADAGRFLTGPDMGTFEEDFKLLRERRPAPAAFGAVVAGVPFEDLLTGYGVAVAAETALRTGPGGGWEGRSVAIEGFGKAGGGAAREVTSRALAGEPAGTGVRVQVCCPGPIATEFHHGTGFDPARLPTPPMNPGDVVTACLGALDLGETVCIPRLGDPAAIEHYHTAARQLLQASGHDLSRTDASGGNDDGRDREPGRGQAGGPGRPGGRSSPAGRWCCALTARSWAWSPRPPRHRTAGQSPNTPAPPCSPA